MGPSAARSTASASMPFTLTGVPNGAVIFARSATYRSPEVTVQATLSSSALIAPKRAKSFDGTESMRPRSDQAKADGQRAPVTPPPSVAAPAPPPVPPEPALPASFSPPPAPPLPAPGPLIVLEVATDPLVADVALLEDAVELVLVLD